MGTSKPLTKDQLDVCKELYKAHFTIQEAANILGTVYHRVVYEYRIFQRDETPKYNRLNLIPETFLRNIDRAA